LSIKASSTANS